MAQRCLTVQEREDDLLTRIRQALTPAARFHCLHATCKEGTLTLRLDSAAWTTRIRYQVPELMQSLGDIGVTAIRLQTGPTFKASESFPMTTRRRLTDTTIDHLLEAAECTNHPPIGAIFRRLAERQRSLKDRP